MAYVEKISFKEVKRLTFIYHIHYIYEDGSIDLGFDMWINDPTIKTKSTANTYYRSAKHYNKEFMNFTIQDHLRIINKRIITAINYWHKEGKIRKAPSMDEINKICYRIEDKISEIKENNFNDEDLIRGFLDNENQSKYYKI